jgi:hypothetical protein
MTRKIMTQSNKQISEGMKLVKMDHEMPWRSITEGGQERKSEELTSTCLGRDARRCEWKDTCRGLEAVSTQGRASSHWGVYRKSMP